MSETPVIRALRARPVNVPIKRPLATATGAVTHAPLVLVDLQTDQGVTGVGYVFTPAGYAIKPLAAVIEGLGEFIKGDPVAPFAIEQKLRKRLTLVGVQGIAMLLQVVAELGAQYRAEKKLRTADGASHDVDYVVKDGEVEVGVKVDKKTEKVTLIPKDCDAGPGKALAGRIAQRWAYSKAVGELKRKGYAVAKEEKQADGSVRVVMQRWR
jgi:hypothetical protein